MNNNITPKKRGNPNFRTGVPNPYPNAGRHDQGVTVTDLLKTVQNVIGTDLETLLACHLLSAKEKYEAGLDYRSYTTMIMSIVDKCVAPLPKHINVDHTGQIEHIQILQEQDAAITERLRQKAYPTLTVDTVDILGDKALNTPISGESTDRIDTVNTKVAGPTKKPRKSKVI